MKLKEIRPALYTRQVKETVDFYTNILGFTCGAAGDDGSWAALTKDDTEVMVTLPNDHVPFTGPRFTGSIYFITEEVDAYWEAVKDQARICYPIETFFYGMREFAIYDNNGYLLQFGEEV
ncbi:VOC family protein [Hufsiella ginkgonis]|uniref:Bleomycin resistance family protein n=1 Tax=Hufsiella ginkgonis TaxID=2695274 RepID=A0A7K1XZ13_9SPHI|nr:VOC family protein [Hufsiella ginkgonis]MXV16193.1 bleomycin resistance family protein [Hufsiella ginkgonis]